MESTTEKIERPVKSNVDVGSRSWKSFNNDGETAEVEFIKTLTLDALPPIIKKALEVAAANEGGLGAIAINWRICCLTKDGATVVKRPSDVYTGERSGGIGICGELDMWSKVLDKQHPSKRTAHASACFDMQGAIYVIDAGMCPCSTCAKSLLSLATLLTSTIVVRGMTDYDVLGRDRTDLSDVAVHVMVFEPAATKYKVYSSRDRTNVAVEKKEAHALLFKCSKSHEYLVTYEDKVDLVLLAKTPPAYKCKKCFGKQKLELFGGKPGLKKENVASTDLEAWVEKPRHNNNDKK